MRWCAAAALAAVVLVGCGSDRPGQQQRRDPCAADRGFAHADDVAAARACAYGPDVETVIISTINGSRRWEQNKAYCSVIGGHILETPIPGITPERTVMSCAVDDLATLQGGS
jgi:hypothetical protein